MYFKNFPKIDYLGKQAKNITARPKILEDVMKNAETFYDFVIPNDMRAEQVADAYYDDAEYVWLVYLSNNVVDPYYEWPLTQEQFKEMIVSKYGSISAAKTKVLHYKRIKKDNKNITDGELISPETYSLNGTFPNIQASDYQPVYAFDYEDDLNEAKRTIKLIDKRFASQIKSELKKVMNG